MSRGISSIAVAALAGTLASYSATSPAGVIYGGSTLLNGAYLAELETWLGEGSLALTNIYTKAPGDSSLDFHAAVDGIGRTFVVMQATENGSGVTAIIGGYDPQSWDSTTGYYHITVPDSSRTGFVFNLTTSALYPQATNSDWCGSCGQYQTFNASSYGPTFGGGFDIGVYSSLAQGYSYLYSYSPDGATAGHSIIDLSPYDGPNVVYGAIEVFTIAAAALPEPGTVALLGVGLLGIGMIGRRTPAR